MRMERGVKTIRQRPCCRLIYVEVQSASRTARQAAQHSIHTRSSRTSGHIPPVFPDRRSTSCRLWPWLFPLVRTPMQHGLHTLALPRTPSRTFRAWRHCKRFVRPYTAPLALAACAWLARLTDWRRIWDLYRGCCSHLCTTSTLRAFPGCHGTTGDGHTGESHSSHLLL